MITMITLIIISMVGTGATYIVVREYFAYRQFKKMKQEQELKLREQQGSKHVSVLDEIIHSDWYQPRKKDDKHERAED
jgi:hypothetical protein